MNPKDYTGEEWTQLAKELTPRQMRNALKRSYRAEAKKALGIARRHLHASGMQVKGSQADWDKGIRSHIYSKGGGFMLTVKARRANSKGKGEKSMHQNRKGFKKPVLMWAEEGTQRRLSKSSNWRYEHSGSWKLWARHGASMKPKKRKVRKDGINRGRMRAYGFLEKATPEMFQTVEADLGVEVGAAVEKVAKKCGFV